MNNKNLFIFAKISPKEEYFKSAKNALLNILEPTQKETGCLGFTLHDDTQHLYLYEEWTNQSSLDEHHLKSYTKEVFEKYQGWLIEPVEVIKMQKTNYDK